LQSVVLESGIAKKEAELVGAVNYVFLLLTFLFIPEKQQTTILLLLK
jgi:hypothetical protein